MKQRNEEKYFSYRTNINYSWGIPISIFTFYHNLKLKGSSGLIPRKWSRWMWTKSKNIVTVLLLCNQDMLKNVYLYLIFREKKKKNWRKKRREEITEDWLSSKNGGSPSRNTINCEPFLVKMSISKKIFSAAPLVGFLISCKWKSPISSK